MSASKTKLAPGKIVFVVISKTFGYFHWYHEEYDWGDLKKATVWEYEERQEAENVAKNTGCRVEAWLSRGSKLVMQIPIEAVS